MTLQEGDISRNGHFGKGTFWEKRPFGTRDIMGSGHMIGDYEPERYSGGPKRFVTESSFTPVSSTRALRHFRVKEG